MLKLLIFLVFVIGCSVFLTQAYSLEVELQKEDERILEEMGLLRPDIEPFQEQFQVIIDNVGKKNRISIGLLSTNPNDIMFSDDIEYFSADPRMFSFTITNQFACAPNSIEEACIIVSIKREGLGNSIEEIKKNTLEITDEIVAATELGYTPEFDSITHQSKTSYDGSEKVIVANAIYTINKQPTNELFNALSTIFVSGDIRTSGGFYTHAQKLSEHYFSEFTISLIPEKEKWRMK